MTLPLNSRAGLALGQVEFFQTVPPTEHPSYLRERIAQVLFSIAEERAIFFLREGHLNTVEQHSAVDFFRLSL